MVFFNQLTNERSNLFWLINNDKTGLLKSLLNTNIQCFFTYIDSDNNDFFTLHISYIVLIENQVFALLLDNES